MTTFTSSSSSSLILAGSLAGAGMALIQYGGLWLTLQALTKARRPLLRLATSLALRFSLVLGGFLLLARLHWVALASAAASFVLIRQVLVRKLAGPVPPPNPTLPDPASPLSK